MNLYIEIYKFFIFSIVILFFYLFFCFLVMAACAIANIVKSSLGPVGLDKMLVDDIGVCKHFCKIYLYKN